MLRVSKQWAPELRLRGTPGDIPEEKPDTGTAPSGKEKKDRQLLCFSCRHPLTSESMQINMFGKHTHHFTNPSGDKFHLRCFRKAPGCETKGVPIDDFTWFPGYKWCFSFCVNCGIQSGWFYLAAEESFFGLIREVLA